MIPRILIYVFYIIVQRAAHSPYFQATFSLSSKCLVVSMTETLVVVSSEMSPAEFLELIPDDGTASYFLPYLLACSLRQLPT